MPALVERRGENDQAEHHHQQRGAVEDLAQRLCDAVVGEEPDVERAEASEHGDHDRREEQGLEDLRDRVDDPLGDERGAQPQRQQRIGLLKLRLGAVRRRDHAQRLESLLDELAVIVRAHAALDRLADRGGDLLVRPLSVGELGDQVEERRKLDHLAVGAAHDVGRLLEPRPLVLADEVDTAREARLLRRRRLRERCLVSDRQNLGVGLFGSGRGGGVVVHRPVRRHVRGGGSPPLTSTRSSPAQLVCVMSTFCCAFAYAIELSLATLSAAARLTGAATFALISDMAARSGSSSPAMALSSSRVSALYSCDLPMVSCSE